MICLMNIFHDSSLFQLAATVDRFDFKFTEKANNCTTEEEQQVMMMQYIIEIVPKRLLYSYILFFAITD